MQKFHLLFKNITCGFEFAVEETSWNAFIKGSTLVISKDFLEQLAVQTVGVARGIMHCKTEGTPFNMLILPPINVRDIISDAITVDLPEDSKK